MTEGSERPSSPPLSGLRVVDLSRVLAGPYCTMVLADLGAEVVKVERPGTGDETRAWGPPFAGGEAAYYLAVNRGKRSCAIDLRDDRGRALALALCERADARSLTRTLTAFFSLWVTAARWSVCRGRTARRSGGSRGTT